MFGGPKVDSAIFKIFIWNLPSLDNPNFQICTSRNLDFTFWTKPNFRISTSRILDFTFWTKPNFPLFTTILFGLDKKVKSKFLIVQIWVVYFSTASHWQKVNSKFLLAENEDFEKMVLLESKFSFFTTNCVVNFWSSIFKTIFSKSLFSASRNLDFTFLDQTKFQNFY